MTGIGRASGGVDAAPASQQGMRRQNLAVVIGAVAAHGPLSRADVAGHTGLTRPAVSSMVDELIGRGALTETETVPSGRVGRPGRALALSDRGPAGLGLEIGVTHLAACVVDLRGEPRVWRRVERANAGRPAGHGLGPRRAGYLGACRRAR
ncbi:ROK family protein, partial [Streptomyces sp. NPDC041003]